MAGPLRFHCRTAGKLERAQLIRILGDLRPYSRAPPRQADRPSCDRNARPTLLVLQSAGRILRGQYAVEERAGIYTRSAGSREWQSETPRSINVTCTAQRLRHEAPVLSRRQRRTSSTQCMAAARRSRLPGMESSEALVGSRDVERAAPARIPKLSPAMGSLGWMPPLGKTVQFAMLLDALRRVLLHIWKPFRYAEHP